MLRVMRSLIRKDLPDVEILISYQDTAVHTGGIYRAAGWTPVMVGGGGEWMRAKRSSIAAQAATPKVRWEVTLL
jgi:hypothetical protein